MFLDHPVVNSITLVNGCADSSIMHVEKCLETQIRKMVLKLLLEKERKKLYLQLSNIPNHLLIYLFLAVARSALRLVGS